MNYFVGSGTGSGPVFDFGALSPRPDPSPELVAMTAQRLAGLARDVDAVRAQLGGMDVQQWRSPAAAVFRESLTGLLTELWAAGQALDGASAEVDGYGKALALNAEKCASPLAGQAGMGMGRMVWGS